MGDNMKLKITADDLGLTKGINYGIYDACKDGIVSSVSLMMNTLYTEHAYELIKPLDVSIGVHLCATYGKPLSSCETLIEYDFLKPEHNYELVKDDLYKEFSAQIDKAIKMNIKVSHLSTYDSSHLKDDAVNEVVKQLGLDYSIPVRGEMKFSDAFHGKMANMDTLFQLCKQKIDTLELVVMPGYLDGHLLNINPYREFRMVEHSILTSTFAKKLINDEHIELIK